VGTLDLGLLILRLVVGALFVGHGTQKLFGWFRGRGPEETGAMLRKLGYRPHRELAILAGLTESGAGLLLMVGFLTPLAAAGIIGVMVNAIAAVHLKNGLWNQNGGIELHLTYIAVALTLAFVGPGSYSVDSAVGLTWGGAWGLGALALGLGTGLLAAFSRRREEPAADTGSGPAGRRAA
jgi:putative oxidoreductase